MRITSIEFWSVPNVGDPFKHATMSVSEADLSQSYILKNATGLDPEEILNQFYGVSGTWVPVNSTKQRYYNLKPAPRTMSFGVKLNPQYDSLETPSSLRDGLYRMIAYDRTGGVQIRFMYHDAEVAEIDGVITKVESDLFDQDSNVVMTVKCLYPFFRSPSQIELKDDIVVPLVSFNDAFSTAPHGMTIDLTLTADQTNAVFQGQTSEPDASRFEIIFPFLTGDVFHFNSEPDNRELYVQRGSIKTYLMDRVSLTSIWPLIFPGLNEITVPFPGATINTFAHYYTYWGV